MELPFWVSGALSAVLERAFEANDEARDALSVHAGGRITVELSSPDLRVHVLVLEHTLEILSVSDDESDATVQTDWVGLAALSRGSDALLAGKARVRGDLRLVEGVHRAVSLLAIDWEDQIAPFVGDTLAHKLGSLFSRVRREGERNQDRSAADVEQYLQHESGLLVSREAWRSLTDDTDVLRSAIDRLAARLARLERRA